MSRVEPFPDAGRAAAAPEKRRGEPEQPPDAAAPRGGTASHDGAASHDRYERVIAEVWREALCVDEVGPHDDFFRLGGHSRLAVKVADRLREAFQADLPMRMIFDHRTVAELATAIAARA
ncbi:phosphopantetheine-binding protein [Streptosporangium roseum]|uniref:Polyketide synthase type I n=1 Tax=Streptosporangium roseum (strain ATCC 12428 / DSM 43021 / JCM 3005 / KCTC 9067 / NCIMB 10171 / NRRL 2505 / NI 9100) TaxID=479432 RepID=D2AQP0_STRRD|nr:phosphopantetheine-binding protein [Streptosporangium roseum]ACZ86437.1 polyketide synthase type I [Streptosporangium roseum DSM 43021]